MEFVPYRPKTILNKNKRADHWFWARYSAYPYVGCQHGCHFCYCRERKYCPYEDPSDFSRVIKVKENAAELLRAALSRTPIDVVFTADYQPAEARFQISRRMLEVCYDLGFPVFVLERSPLVLRDLDILQAIQRRAGAIVAFSVIYTPETQDATRIREMERFAPRPDMRFRAMSKLAAAGITTGTCMMPILPLLCDTEQNLTSVVQWTKDHGGQFVLPGSLTLADQQREHFLSALSKHFPELLGAYRDLYPDASYGPRDETWKRTARRIREICQGRGILDRIPRPIVPGDKRTLNKRIVEILANAIRALDLDGRPPRELQPYRDAANAIEDLPQSIDLVYNALGLRGLLSIPGVAPSIAPLIERALVDLTGASAPRS